MKYRDEDVEKLLKEIDQMTPYVQATIGDGCVFPSSTRKDWVEIHDGRRRSSERHLERLVELVKEIRTSAGSGNGPPT